MSGVGRNGEIEENSRIGVVGLGRTDSTIVEIVGADMIDTVRVVQGAAEVGVEEVDLVAEPSMMTILLAAAKSSSKDEA